MSTDSTPDSSPAAIIARLLEEHGLSESTRLYRESLFSTLAPTGVEGVFRHAANPEPRESVIDVYAEGHIVQAERMGPGLAFAESASPNWQETMELHTLRQSPGEPLDPHVEVGRHDRRTARAGRPDVSGEVGGRGARLVLHAAQRRGRGLTGPVTPGLSRHRRPVAPWRGRARPRAESRAGASPRHWHQLRTPSRSRAPRRAPSARHPSASAHSTRRPA